MTELCRVLGKVLAPKIAVAIACAGTIGGAAALAGGQPGDAKVAAFAERFHAGAGGTDCSTGAWPYLEAHCLRMPNGSQARPVRMIAVDRELSSGRGIRPIM